MRHIILRQNENLASLPVSFNNNVLEVKKQLDLGYPLVMVTQVQIIKDKIFKTQRIISGNNIFQLFGDQVEMLLNILKYLSENIEPYERYQLFKGLIDEINMIKDLPTQPIFKILSNHIDFMKAELIPIIENHLNRINDVLNIKDHKSHVRKKLVEKGLVEFTQPNNDETLQEILEFLKLKCATQKDFNCLQNELLSKEASIQEHYNIKNCGSDEMLLFFKILKKRQIISEISNSNLSKWLFRKFKYSKNGEYVIGLAQRTILDKLNSSLTAKERQKKLDINFKI